MQPLSTFENINLIPLKVKVEGATIVVVLLKLQVNHLPLCDGHVVVVGLLRGELLVLMKSFGSFPQHRLKNHRKQLFAVVFSFSRLFFLKFT